MNTPESMTNPYQYSGTLASEAIPVERATFIRQTYLHLFGAILAFAGLEALLLQLPVSERLIALMVGGRYSWLIVLAAFVGVSHLANTWASSATSLKMQYAGLGLYVVAEAVIFLPLLAIARQFGDATLIPAAAMITLLLFGGLTAVVFITGADFSFLRTTLYVAGFAALALCMGGAIFGFNLGLVFVVAMIAFACGYILYDTSNVLHHYRIGQHVAASLALFASVALLFWYVIRLLMRFSSRD